MISGQSPESRAERRQLRRDKEAEAQLAQAALHEIVTVSNKDSSQETDTTDSPDDDV